MSSIDEPGDSRPGTQAVDRALAILGCFRNDAGQLGISEIARSVGLNVSTAHRLMRALVAAGYMQQDPVTERYHLGIEVAVLGQRALEQAGYHLAKPILTRLAAETGESASLGVRRNSEVVVIERAASAQPLRFDHASGAEIDLHTSGMGKVLLAFSGYSPQVAVGQLRSLPRYTDHTICDRDELVQVLLAARINGYATNLEERHLGACGVGAPVLGPSGVATAAVGVQGPAVRMSAERLSELAPLVRAAADEIAALALRL